MRGIFDQYRDPENRLTHALLCCLSEDRPLARQFLRWVLPGVSTRADRIRILEQQVPGRPSPDDEDEARGLPDGWLYNPNDRWALLIESKISASVAQSQLGRHLAIAARADFSAARLLLLTTKPVRSVRSNRIISRTWSELYEWFGRRCKGSPWATRFVEYLRAAEVRLVSDDYLVAGTLTRFDGFHSSEEQPYTAREGRRLIKLVMGELRQRTDLRTLIDSHRPGRSAITGRGTQPVWDFIWLRAARQAKGHTVFPHLTFAIWPDYLEAAVTFPNGMRSEFCGRLAQMPPKDFERAAKRVRIGAQRVIRSVPGATIRMRLNQRHFLSQNSQSLTDAELDFDLHTVFPRRRGRTKYQPEWLEAVLSVLEARRSNIQLQVWCKIPYVEGATNRRSILEVIAGAWLACRPMISAVIRP